MIKISNENFDFNIFNLNNDKIFFIENSARGIIVEECGTNIKIEDYLKNKVNVTDSALRATCVVTFGKGDISEILKETKELYNFLIEGDDASFRVDFPKEVAVFDIKRDCIEV